MGSYLKKLKLDKRIQARMNRAKLRRLLQKRATMESHLKKLRKLVETIEARINRASESSSPSQEGSDDGFAFEETEETGRNDRSQDAISFNEGGSSQDDKRRLPRGSEEENDEPPTRSSAQGGGSESDISLSTRAMREQYLKKCTFTLYIQMDLMEMTLKSYITRRNEGYLGKKSCALSEEDRETARGIFWDLCMAVCFVHDRGFIHRDLKPSNVLLSPNENPGPYERPYSIRLSDFGLSTRLVDEFGGMYKTVGCGTVSYAAPEQLKGGPGSTSKGAKYGKGVDVYSLALIAVELWTPMSESERLRVFDGLRSPQRLTRWFLGLWSVGGSASGGFSGMGLVPGLVSAATDDDGGRGKG
ncbi:unnamed protein product [Cyprideis torosa]|uniref:non-specific serine/threonine protein kinase n=1 Tax=Cyprideis torosa TaxID=163714 RepID=A0A7R8WRY5_9CRUS|nr:unnamed protein product [Cyprideis torosa]CAG0907289.1 unnamed protein product [Cyprideis torosa]